jgi:hypothetical protein
MYGCLCGEDVVVADYVGGDCGGVVVEDLDESGGEEEEGDDAAVGPVVGAAAPLEREEEGHERGNEE